MPENKDDLITIQQARLIAKTSWVAVQRWVDEGLLENYSISVNHYVSKTELEALLECREQHQKRNWIAPWRVIKAERDKNK